jgi:hypothetical protein
MVIPNHMGVSPVTGVTNTEDKTKLPIYKEIQKLPPEKRALHDIHLKFQVPDIWTIISSSLDALVLYHTLNTMLLIRRAVLVLILPILDERQLQQIGAKIHKNIGVRHLPSEESPLLAITGEIPRETSFEKGFPFQYTEDPDNENKLVPDPLIKDDQAIVANVLDKGLVILTGYRDTGVVNTINYPKKITGINKIHAVIGGFHLPADGGIYEAAIEPTLKELQKSNPDYLVPCHCTGWKATNRIIETNHYTTQHKNTNSNRCLKGY